MKRWQRYWLWLVIAYSSLHLVRDVCQDLEIKNFLSTILVKSKPPRIPPIYWRIFNTYLIAIIEIILAAFCLRKKSFGKLGYLTVFMALVILVAWSFYWFFF